MAEKVQKAEKFKSGDKVKIVEKHFGHQFEIGTIVTLDKGENGVDDYVAENIDSGECWWVCDSELELIKPS